VQPRLKTARPEGTWRSKRVERPGNGADGSLTTDCCRSWVVMDLNLTAWQSATAEGIQVNHARSADLLIDLPPTLPVNSRSIDFPRSLAILNGILALGFFSPRSGAEM